MRLMKDVTAYLHYFEQVFLSRYSCEVIHMCIPSLTSVCLTWSCTHICTNGHEPMCQQQYFKLKHFWKPLRVIFIGFLVVFFPIVLQAAYKQFTLDQLHLSWQQKQKLI